MALCNQICNYETFTKQFGVLGQYIVTMWLTKDPRAEHIWALQSNRNRGWAFEIRSHDRDTI